MGGLKEVKGFGQPHNEGGTYLSKSQIWTFKVYVIVNQITLSFKNLLYKEVDNQDWQHCHFRKPN